MSEGYICDRCGSTHGGSPDTMLLLGDGRARSRERLVSAEEPGFEYEQPTLGDVEFDLCLACRNDLRQWWAEGGGDPTEVSRDE